VLSRNGVAAANLGLAEAVKYMLPGQIRTLPNEGCDTWGCGPSGVGVMRNRLGMREGPGCLECQRLGNATSTLHAALLQSAPPVPGGESIIRVFAAWPLDWNAQFTLAARGGFLVSASMEKGKIEFVQIQSQAGGECRLVNPWPAAAPTLYRNGVKAEEVTGELVKFGTHKGEMIIVVPPGALPVRKQAL
jgi:hypothetical protein